MNLDISKRFARISQPIGLPTWSKPRNSYFRPSKHAAALEMPSCSHTMIASLLASEPRFSITSFSLAQSSLLISPPP